MLFCKANKYFVLFVKMYKKRKNLLPYLIVNHLVITITNKPCSIKIRHKYEINVV